MFSRCRFVRREGGEVRRGTSKEGCGVRREMRRRLLPVVRSGFLVNVKIDFRLQIEIKYYKIKYNKIKYNKIKYDKIKYNKVKCNKVKYNKISIIR